LANLYKRPLLKNHKVLYRGKRYWVFEVDNENPYESAEIASSLVVFDKLYGAIAAFCNQINGSGYEGVIPIGQNSIEIKAENIRALVAEVIYWDRQMVKLFSEK
jgi:hypothetical protein